jgi:hypothetical protein
VHSSDHSNGLRVFCEGNSNVFRDSAPAKCDLSRVIIFCRFSFETESHDSTPLLSMQQKSVHQNYYHRSALRNLTARLRNDAKGSFQRVRMILKKLFQQMVIFNSLSAESTHSEDSELPLPILSDTTSFCYWTGNDLKNEYLICMNWFSHSGFRDVSLDFDHFLRSRLLNSFI